MIGARVFGGVLLALGVLAFVASLGVGDDWSASGPRLAPAVSAALLVVLALAFLVWPGDELAAHVAEVSEGTHWPTPALLLGLLVAYALLLERARLRAGDDDLLLARRVAARLRPAGARRDRRPRAGRRDLVRVLALAQRAAADRALGRLMVLVFAANLLDGFSAVLTPENLLLAALGVTLGTLVGVLPGIGPALTIALLLPITFNFEDPVGAFILFAGIYAGGMYGGSTTSILLEHAGRVGVGGDGDRGLRDGQTRAAGGRPWPRRRSGRSWPGRSGSWR